MPAILKKATDTATPDSGTVTVVPRASFQAPRDELKRALKQLAAVADSKSALPILGYVCIRVNGASTTLTTTDLNVSMTVKAPWIGDCFGLCVEAKALADIVVKLPQGPVTITRVDALEATVSSGPVTMRLPAIADREFPKTPQTEDLRWSRVAAGELAAMFEGALPFVCEDPTRFHLNGVLFESGGGYVRTVSTDGHRLTKLQRVLGGCPAYPAGVIVPTKGARQLVRMLRKVGGDCELAVTQRFLFVRHDGATIAIKHIDATFPPYEQVIPKDHKRCFSVDRAELAAALERAKLFCAPEKKGRIATKGVKLTIGGGALKLVTDGASESLQAHGEAAERDELFSIGFSPQYLLDFLEVIEDKCVTIELGDELAPAILRGTQHAIDHTISTSPQVCVVMPMRI